MKENKDTRHARRNGVSLTSLGLALLSLPGLSAAVTTEALAQTATGAPAAATTTASDEVVVTGSRVARSGFETPTPLTSITPQEMQLKAPSSFVSMLTEIPQLSPNQTTARATNVGASVVNLRNLGSERNLILLDGRRLAPTSPTGGGVDINILPAPLINRVEVVTGGASAAYGSDALSGVMNIFLDSKMTGFKAEAQGGQTTHGDNQEYSVALSYGTPFANDRGHLVVSAGKYAVDGIMSQTARDWADSWGYIDNTAWTATNGVTPRKFLVPGVYNSRFSDGGVIIGVTGGVSTQALNIKFGENGAQSPFVVGRSGNSNHAIGGDGSHFSDYAVLAPNVERANGFARATYDFTDNLSVWGEALYAKTEQRYAISPNYDIGLTTGITPTATAIVIQRDNAYLPANILALFPASGGQISVGRSNIDGGFNDYLGVNEVQRYATGFTGKLGETWSWDLSYQYSKNNYQTITYNNRDQQRWKNAVDAVRNGSGQIVCRINADATTANDDAACAPMNVFGTNMMSAATKAYISGISYVDAEQTQEDGSFNIQGEPFSTWAGPVSIATGAEYRVDKVVQEVDARSIAQAWRANNSLPFTGSTNVAEFYVETVVPLLKDSPLAKSLEINGAGRSTNYSTSGPVKTWKLGLNYQPFEDLRIRATKSRDIRAPNISELYSQGTLRTGVNLVPDITNQAVSISITSLTRGNPDLTPEIGDTITYGFVYQPSWFEGFRASVDRYEIEITDALVTVASQAAYDRCNRGETNFCVGIIRNSAGVVTRIDALSYNAQAAETGGLDFELSYRFDADKIFGGMPGEFTIRQLANFVDYQRTINPPSLPTYSDGSFNNPHWRGTTTINYTNDKFSARLAMNFVGSTRYDLDMTNAELPNNDIPRMAYLNTSASYNVSDRLQLFGRVENLLDTDPPATPGTLIINNQVGGGFYDKIGRTIAVGLRYKM